MYVVYTTSTPTSRCIYNVQHRLRCICQPSAIPTISYEKQFEASPSPRQYRARSRRSWRALVSNNARASFSNVLYIDSGQSRAPCIVFVTSLCNCCGKKHLNLNERAPPWYRSNRDARLVKLCLAYIICWSFVVERASFARIASRGRRGENLFRTISFEKKEKQKLENRSLFRQGISIS